MVVVSSGLLFTLLVSPCAAYVLRGNRRALFGSAMGSMTGPGGSRFNYAPAKAQNARAYQNEPACTGPYCGMAEGFRQFKEVLSEATLIKFLSNTDVVLVQDRNSFGGGSLLTGYGAEGFSSNSAPANSYYPDAFRTTTASAGDSATVVAPQCIIDCPQWRSAAGSGIPPCDVRSSMAREAAKHECVSDCSSEVKQALYKISSAGYCDQLQQQQTTQRQRIAQDEERTTADEQKEDCLTMSGSACIFPFRFRGQVYNSCTVTGDTAGKAWCSTKTDQHGNHVSSGGHWGYCKPQLDTCYTAAKQKTTISSTKDEATSNPKDKCANYSKNTCYSTGDSASDAFCQVNCKVFTAQFDECTHGCKD